MMFSDVCKLCTETVTFDRYNRPVKTGYTKRTVFCNENGVRQSEFYQAQAAGLKPEIMLEIQQAEYQGEKFVEFNQVIYKILRTYPKKGERLELVATGRVND